MNTQLSVVAPTKQQSIKTDGNTENNSGATLKINGITLEINNDASPRKKEEPIIYIKIL